MQGALTFLFTVTTLFQTYDFKIIGGIAFPIYVIGMFFEVDAAILIEQKILKNPMY